MRLVLAILCFLLGSVSFWVAFHPVQSKPTPSGVLANVKNAIVNGKVPAADTSTNSEGSNESNSGSGSSSSSAATSWATSPLNPVHDAEAIGDAIRHKQASTFDQARHDIASLGDDLLP